MYTNLSRDVFGIGPEDGTTHQVSSYGRRSGWFPGTIGEFQKKCVDLAPGELHTVADMEGPGVITRIWMAMPRRINPGVLRKLVLRMRWDGEDEPSVLVPLGDLFGTTFGVPRDYSSAWLTISSGAYLCFFPMPFARRALITVENQSRLPVTMLFYQVTFLKLDRELPAGTPYFHCHWKRREMARGGEPFDILDARGAGLYMGCHLDMEGAGWPWRPNPMHVQLPEGFGLGMLEGWERIWIDGAGEPNVHGTGGEDYFNGAWYFTKCPSTCATHGVTMRSYASRRVSCYRFHAEMPISFRESITVTLDHGLDNVLPAAYSGTTYWYQVEPHQPLEELPDPRARRAGRGGRNRIVMATPFIAAAAGVLAHRCRR